MARWAHFGTVLLWRRILSAVTYAMRRSAKSGDETILTRARHPYLVRSYCEGLHRIRVHLEGDGRIGQSTEGQVRANCLRLDGGVQSWAGKW